MPDEIRFVIVTNDAERALAESFGCAQSNKPTFVRIVTDPDVIERIPNGTKVHGLFYSPRNQRSEQQRAMLYRQIEGGLVGLDDEDYDYVNYWLKLRNAAAAEKAARYPDHMTAPLPEERESVIAKPKPEIEKLILSQRWT